MRKRATSGQARLLAAVSELDASPPSTEVAARRLAGVIGALVPADLATVNLGDPRPFHDVAFDAASGPSILATTCRSGAACGDHSKLTISLA